MRLFQGGVGSEGLVCDVSGRDESWGSIVDVRWDSGSINRYRLGIEGKVDVQAVESVVGGKYYFEHLPQLCKYWSTAAELNRVESYCACSCCDFVKYSMYAWSSSIITVKVFSQK